MQSPAQKLSSPARRWIDASVPVLREHGAAITRRFYARLFEAHPELKNLFNQGNQASGVQQGSLAAAVLAYAANIDNPDALKPVLERIAHKHASVGIQPSQYDIVGRHLLLAISEVLGANATPDLLAAWEQAYGLLAGELIGMEARLYEKASGDGGAFRDLLVARVRDERGDAKSYYLTTPGGESPGQFSPGQYVSVAVYVPVIGLRQIRQYSLSDAPQRPYWRITVKREEGTAHRPAGNVSNWLHANVREGDKLSVSAAFGNFIPVPGAERPIALLSAGVGITPMVAALNALAENEHEQTVLFAHAARSDAHRVLHDDVHQARARLPRLQVLAFVEQANEPLDTETALGRMELSERQISALRDADFFLCGPLAFMAQQRRALLTLGIPPQRIQREVFGPELLEHLL